MNWDDLEQKLGRTWPAIRDARRRADEQLGRIRPVLSHGGPPVDSGDISVVVFGSLARGEWTAGSDLDWTLLIDGQADHRHALTAQGLGRSLADAGFKGPGPTGVFGNLAFSHGLIHAIGGDDDSNANTTRRLLLLLESRPVGRADAHERVVRALLRRYLHDDRRFRPGIPHVLLNDVQRYWRTVCVDYAYKNRERAGSQWGLRVVKLRFSRKLLFAAGLLTCFLCDEKLVPPDEFAEMRQRGVDGLIDYLLTFVRRPPLDIVIEGFQRFGDGGTTVKVLDAYNEFLTRLNDEATRKALETLLPNQEDDPTLGRLKDAGRDFQAGIVSLFFDGRLGEFTRKFGMF